jgi:3-mercaptopyruvate sulfurtransferase SseA
MTAWSKGKRQMMVWCAVAVVLVTFLVIWGCGSSSYDDLNTTTKTPVVIGAETLAGWMAEGKLNAPPGTTDRVVLLSVTTMANYTTSTKLHIPGAQLLDQVSDIYKTRPEGISLALSMVPDGAQMDTVIRRIGIDDKTTIVFTCARNVGNPVYQTRAYYIFRYWGFPKERLKILNGGDDAWNDKVVSDGYPVLTKATAAVQPSTYSVVRNVELKDILRYSIGDMITLVDNINRNPSLLSQWQIIDARGAANTPFIANAVRQTGGAFLDQPVGQTYRFPDKATLLTRFAATTAATAPDGTTVAIDPNKKTITYCNSGTACTIYFAIFDAVLGVPEGQIIVYGGSMSQWGSYASTRITTAAGVEASGIWGTDAVTPGTIIPRTAGTGTLTGTFVIDPYLAITLTPDQLEANQIILDDRRYFKSGASTGSATGGSAGGGC